MFITGYKRTSAFTAASGDSAYIANSVEPDVVADWEAAVYWKAGTAQAAFTDVLSFTRTGGTDPTYMDSSGDWQQMASGNPRVGHYSYNGTSYVDEGMRFEEDGTTNLRLNSEGTTDVTATNGTVTGADANSPLGASNAHRFHPDTSNSNHYANAGGSSEVSYTSGTTYSFSTLMSARGSQQYTRMALPSGSFDEDNRHFGYDMTNFATAGGATGCTPYLERVGANWAVIAGSKDSNATASVRAAFFGLRETSGYAVESYVGDIADGVWLDGCQVEARPISSSYVPTSGTTASRSDEAMSVPAANHALDGTTTAFSFNLIGKEWYADEGTSQQVLLVSAGDTADGVRLTLDTDGAKTGTLTLTVYVASSSVSKSATVELTPGINKAFAVACRLTDSNINIALNGTAETQATNSLSNLPNLSADDFNFGGNGTRKQFAIWDADIGDTGIATASTGASWPA